MESNRDILLNPSAALDDLPGSRLSSLLSDAPPLAEEMLRGAADERPDAHIVIQNVSAIASRALHEHNAELFSEAIASLREIWKVGNPRAMYPTTTPAFEASLWELIAAELYALGGLAVSLERWAAVHELSAEKPDPDTLRESWLRQGQVASARAATVPDDTMLEIATRPLSRLEPSLSEPDARAALSRFDLLSCLIIRQADPDGFYPNASKFSESLAEPVVFERLRDPNDPLREYVYPGDQDGLREALRDYDEKARLAAAQARRRSHDWQWRGFSDERTLLFIFRGQRPEDWEIGGGWS
jgi:hypothetical protein